MGLTVLPTNGLWNGQSPGGNVGTDNTPKERIPAMPDTQNITLDVKRLTDEADIRQVTAAFADAATCGDSVRFGATWAADATWVIGEHVNADGVDAIVGTFEGMIGGQDFFVQLASQGPIHINGDRATATCIVQEMARSGDSGFYRNFARTRDELTRKDSRWVFSRREFNYIWLDTSAFAGESFQDSAG